MTFNIEPEHLLAYAVAVLGIVLSAMKISTAILGSYRARIARQADEARVRRYFPNADDPNEDQSHSVPKTLEQLQEGHDHLTELAGRAAAGAAENGEAIAAAMELIVALDAALRLHMKDEKDERAVEHEQIEGMITRLFEQWRGDATAVLEGTPPDNAFQSRAKETAHAAVQP